MKNNKSLRKKKREKKNRSKLETSKAKDTNWPTHSEIDSTVMVICYVELLVMLTICAGPSCTSHIMTVMMQLK